MLKEKILRTHQIHLLTILPSCVLLLISCISLKNTCRPTSVEPLVSLVHMTESDAPILSELMVTDSGQLILAKDMTPAKCRQVADPEVLDEVRNLVAAAGRTEYSTSTKFGLHYEQIQLRFDSRVVGIVAGENSPASFEALLEYLDGLFEEKFGESYQVNLEPFYSD